MFTISLHCFVDGPVQKCVDGFLAARGVCLNDFLFPFWYAQGNEERAASVNVTVEDTGVGISDIDEALRIAGTSARLTPMNEHGMGLKRVIACSNFILLSALSSDILS